MQRLADELWGSVNGESVKERKVGQGRLIWGKTLQEILREDRTTPDFEYPATPKDANLDYIHRTCEEAEIYFVSNQKNRPEKADCLFRVSGKQPEIWDPVTGERWPAANFRHVEGRTLVPLEFAPRQSWFVVFRKFAPSGRSVPQNDRQSNFLRFTTACELTGPWTVEFDPAWGGPESVVFERLEDWTRRTEEGIRYYSGTATYRKMFDLPPSLRGSGKRLYIDLGTVRNIAQVRLNGTSCGVVWTAPWHAEISGLVQPKDNKLEIDVANLWPNRLIGDAHLPPDKQFTVTNVKKFKKDSPLLESGLLGPVTLTVAE